MPKTKLGKWSACLIIAFLVFVAIGNVIISTGQQGGETFFDNLYISIPMLLAAICAVASLIVGLTSIIKSKERSILVYVSTIMGSLVTWFIVGEMLFPH